MDTNTWIYIGVGVVIVVIIVWLMMKKKKDGPSEPTSMPPTTPGI